MTFQAEALFTAVLSLKMEVPLGTDGMPLYLDTEMADIR